MHDRVPPWRFAFGNTVESAGVCRALRASRFRSLCRDRVDRPAAAITHCGLDDRGKKDGANRRDYSPGAELVLSPRAPRSFLGKLPSTEKACHPEPRRRRGTSQSHCPLLKKAITSSEGNALYVAEALDRLRGRRSSHGRDPGLRGSG